MRPHISIVVPCHNHGHLLGEALGSIAAQGVPEVEVIVVDDRSSDDTVSVASSMGARVIPSHGKGAGSARNAGIAVAEGDILGFLDADDLWPPDSLALRLAALDDYDAAFGAIEEFVDSEFDSTGTVPRSFGATFSAGTVLMTRPAWLQVGPIDESLSVGEFIDWGARFKDAGLRALDVGRVVLQRRIHATNTTRGIGSSATRSYLEVARLHRRRRGQ